MDLKRTLGRLPRGKSAIGAFVVALIVAFVNGLADNSAGSGGDSGAMDRRGSSAVGEAQAGGGYAAASSSDAILERAFREQRNDLQVRGAGRVIKVLADDLKGSRHQRFLLKLGTGQTLLVAHNIDLAPRIPDLREGDDVGFYGEYEWTDRGGVIHWTHHDPGGRHEDGWLEHDGERYE